MDSSAIIEVIRIIPSILRLLLAALIFILFYKPLKYELLPRLRGLKMFGFEAVFLEELHRVVLEQAGELSEQDRTNVLRRAILASSVLHGARILWVDDNPGYNLAEHRILTSLGIILDVAHSTTEALTKLKDNHYHAVISDIIRNGNRKEGYDFVHSMQEKRIARHTIFYSSSQPMDEAVPENIFAITHRADHLVHYVIDILERVRA